jgi:hypothetical protein
MTRALAAARSSRRVFGGRGSSRRCLGGHALASRRDLGGRALLAPRALMLAGRLPSGERPRAERCETMLPSNRGRMIRGGVVLSRGCFGFMPPLWCVLLRAGLTRAASCSVRFAAIAGSSAHSPLLDAYSAFPLSACGPSARSPPAFFSALPRFAASPPLRLELSEPDEPLSPLLFWLALESCWLPLLL